MPYANAFECIHCREEFNERFEICPSCGQSDIWRKEKADELWEKFEAEAQKKHLEKIEKDWQMGLPERLRQLQMQKRMNEK